MVKLLVIILIHILTDKTVADNLTSYLDNKEVQCTHCGNSFGFFFRYNAITGINYKVRCTLCNSINTNIQLQNIALFFDDSKYARHKLSDFLMYSKEVEEYGNYKSKAMMHHVSTYELIIPVLVL